MTRDSGRPAGDERKLQLEDQLCFALYAATNSIVRAYRPRLAQIGLTYPQYLLMMALWQFGPSPVGRLAARLTLPPHALSPMLDRLELSGLVHRERDLRDRRSVTVSLTERGVALESAAAEVQHSVGCATGLAPDAMADLRERLHLLVDNMVDDLTDDQIARTAEQPRPAVDDGAAS